MLTAELKAEADNILTETLIILSNKLLSFINPFAPGDFAEKRAFKLVKWFSGHCRAIKS